MPTPNGHGPRRNPDLFARLATATLAFSLALLAWGCSKQEEGAAARPEGKTGAEAPKAEIPTDLSARQRLIVGSAGDPKTYNPPLTSDTESTKIKSLLFSALVNYNNIRQEFEPGLAKSWEYREESREWVFHLRERLKWSDGHPLTSDDALFGTEVIFDDSVPAIAKEYLELEGVRFEFSAPDPLTFIAKIPDVDSFSFLNLGMVDVLPRHKYGEALKSGKFAEMLGLDSKPEDIVGSGAFRLKEFKSGERIVLEKNPHYYKKDAAGNRLPYLEELVFLNVPDFDAMELRFQAGDLDLYDVAIQPHNLTTFIDGQEKGNYTLHNPGLALTNNHYWFNLKPGGSWDGEGGTREIWEPDAENPEPPAEAVSRNYRPFVDPVKQAWFMNEDFRKACSMATNRTAMVKSIYFGEGEGIYGYTEPSNINWYNPDIPKFPYDLKKAGELLTSIGFVDRDSDGIREDPEGNPVRFTIITNKENKIRDKMGVLLKGDLATLGFDVTLQLVDFNSILTKLHDTYDYEACLLGLASGVPAHPAMGANIWLSSARMHTWNPNQKTPATPWEARLDELFLSMRRTFDEEEQKRIFFEMQHIWAEHQAVIHLVTGQLYVAASNKVGNIKPALLRPYLLHNVDELFIRN